MQHLILNIQRGPRYAPGRLLRKIPALLPYIVKTVGASRDAGLSSVSPKMRAVCLHLCYPSRKHPHADATAHGHVT